MNFHLHLHVLVTDGAFAPTGWPKIDLYAFERFFRHQGLEMLLRGRRIDEVVIRKLRGGRHSGFTLHSEVRIGAQDGEGRRAVAEYILRSSFSQEEVRYHAATGTVIYHSKMHPVLRRNFEVFSACDWLAAPTAHIPNSGEHPARFLRERAVKKHDSRTVFADDAGCAVLRLVQQREPGETAKGSDGGAGNHRGIQ